MPRFWLNRFAAERRGSKSFVWQFTATGAAVRVSTKDAAIQGGFYGPEEAGLEQLLSEAEARWAPLFRRLDEGADPNTLKAELWGAVHLLAWRVSPLREGFVEAGKKMLSLAAAPEGASALADRLRGSSDGFIDEQVEEVISKLPLSPAQRAQIQQLKPQLRELVRQQMADTGFAPGIRSLLNLALPQIDLEAKAKIGHNRGLHKVLEADGPSGDLVPDRWITVTDPDRGFFLGDSPVLGIGPSVGDVGAVWKHGGKYREVYVPLSPALLLVGLRGPESPSLTLDAYKSAAASICQSCFWGPRHSETETPYARLIGSNWRPISEDELRAIILDGPRGM